MTEVIKVPRGRIIQQGDVTLIPVDELPSNLVPGETKEGQHIIAHSETGHNHVISASDADFFMSANDEEAGFIGYVDIKKETNLVHLRGYDTHKTLGLAPGKYKIARQREYHMGSYRLAAD